MRELEYGVLYILYFDVVWKWWKGFNLGISSSTRMRGHPIDLIELAVIRNTCFMWLQRAPCLR